MPNTRVIVIALAVLTVVRLVIGAANELSEDESYYYLWSQHLAPSFYSKGPGIAFAMKLSTSIFGANEFGVRMLSPLLGFATSLLFLRLGRHLFDEQTAAWGVALLNLTPLFNVGSVLLTIDPLSIFFWVAAMLTLWRALHRASSFTFYWPLTGLLIGLGFLCKYTNAFQLLSILLLLSVMRRWRGQLLRPGPYLLLLGFGLCTIPVLVWNAGHDWITLTHLQERGNLDQSFHLRPTEFLEFLGIHFGIYSPFIFAGLLWAIWLAIKRYRVHDGETYLLFFTLPIVLVYFVLSINESGEGNWTAPGFIGAGLLLAHYWQDLQLENRLKRNLRSTALTVAGILSCIALNSEIVRQAGIPWPYAKDPSKRLRGWTESAAYLDEVLKTASETLGEDLFVIAQRYQDAAVLSFYLPPDAPLFRPRDEYPRIHIVESQTVQNQFSLWPRYDNDNHGHEAGAEATPSPFLGKHALFVSVRNANDPAPPPNITNAFERVEVTGVTDIVRFNQLLRRVKIYTCYNYKGLPL